MKKKIYQELVQIRKKEKDGKMTNLERIKSMTAEELAVTIMCPNEIGMAEIECALPNDVNCGKCCLEWLRAEVTA